MFVQIRASVGRRMFLFTWAGIAVYIGAGWEVLRDHWNLFAYLCIINGASLLMRIRAETSAATYEAAVHLLQFLFLCPLMSVDLGWLVHLSAGRTCARLLFAFVLLDWRKVAAWNVASCAGWISRLLEKSTHIDL
eukprot:gb/GFBE01055285.1/.p1 GENE.gb/GFBE01055285.1/~~gb/GFBE01055285.1/.p1  ORF type:complete len:135 (+),score=12.74 gb/GFBE01055285.1/:1-405(+)